MEAAVMSFFDRFKIFLYPEEDPDLRTAFSRQKEFLPTLWLLGKTGAGKSTLIHALTGDSQVQIGNGFSPCTSTSHSYGFPGDMPLMRFLDTRGLSDASYDAAEDIRACQDRSNALIVVMKAEEPEQGDVLRALEQIRKSDKIRHALLVQTGIRLIIDEHERSQCVIYNREQTRKVWGRTMDHVEVDFELEDGSSVNVDVLRNKLSEMMPVIAQFNQEQDSSDLEKQNFFKLKKEVLWYAGAAGASDVFPVTGTVTVPGIQAKMLHAIACRYGFEWSRRHKLEFAAALGAGFGVQFAARLGLRQVIKLIPVYGQTVGSATAAGVSFCSTFALGRVAAKYLYHKKTGEPVSQEELLHMYKKAFYSVKEVAGSATVS